MTNSARLVPAICALSLLNPVVTWARPNAESELTQTIEKARQAFVIQDYEAVIQLLDQVLMTPELESHREQARTLEMLGSSYWFTGAQASARIVFSLMLRKLPFHQLDAFVYPPELITFFEQRRSDLVEASLIPARPSDAALPSTRSVLVRELVHRETPTFTYLMPFSLGQFANKEPGKGVAFAVIQGVGLATMAATWLGVESLKFDETDLIHASDRGQAELLRGLWYGGLGLFAGSWIWSIIDGFAQRQTSPLLHERMELLEDAPASSFHFQLSPSGLSLSGHF